jgi:hypothetical protein
MQVCFDEEVVASDGRAWCADTKAGVGGKEWHLRFWAGARGEGGGNNGSICVAWVGVK